MTDGAGSSAAHDAEAPEDAGGRPGNGTTGRGSTGDPAEGGRPGEEGPDATGDRRAVSLRRVGTVVLAATLLLFGAKGAVWYLTGSLAVGSEAVNSLADSVYSVVIVAGLYLTTRPPDFEHPHGHERIEPFVSLFVATGVFAAGGVIFWQSADAVLSGSVAVRAGVPAMVVLAASGAVKYGLYRYCLAVGESRNSPALVATALDNRNDILTAVAALVGVVGAATGYPVLDPLAAAVVAVAVLYTGVEIVRDNLNYLVGAAPPEELREEIVRRALDHPDVEGVHDVVAHYVGPEVDVSLHVEVEGDRTLIEAHEVETDVIGAIRAIPEIDDVFVHVDPKELGEWKADDRVDRLADAASDPPADPGEGTGPIGDPDPGTADDDPNAGTPDDPPTSGTSDGTRGPGTPDGSRSGSGEGGF